MKISVIIPVYNVEKYLNKCMSSVLNQTFTNFEVLLINDGSEDNSGTLCDEYALKDKRVRVFHHENKGVSIARNIGLNNAIGEWICFVDSDDWVNKNYLENLIASSNEDVNLVIGGFKKVKDDEAIVDVLKWEHQIVNSQDLYSLLEKKALFNYGYPFSKLYLRNIILKNGIHFRSDVKMFEDSLFLMEYLSYCKQVKFVEHVDYFYLQREGSLSKVLHSYESEFTAFSTLYLLAKKNFYLSDSDLLNQYGLLGYRISTLMHRSLVVLYRSDFSRKERLNKLNNYTSEYWGLYNRYYMPKSIVKKILKIILVKNKSVGDAFIASVYFLIKNI